METTGKAQAIALSDKARAVTATRNRLVFEARAQTRVPSSATSSSTEQAPVHLTRLLLAASTMKLRDVPLAFLPTFEAAGRLGSFAAAATELCLTPSAVSQQIRALEEALGRSLFERTGRTAALTLDGEAYHREVRKSLQELATATSRLRRRSHEAVLRMSTMSIAAHEFLMPRLGAFQARFPGIELLIEASNEVMDFSVTDYDAALRLGEDWPDLQVHGLGRACVAAVCAPQLAASIQQPRDVCQHTLLDPSGAGERALQLLMASEGNTDTVLRAVRTWRFETCFDSLRAAEHGLGVAFGVFPVATPFVLQGKLAVPLAARIPLPGQVCFVHRPDDHRFPFADIAEWMVEQYRGLPALPEGRIVP